MIEEVYGMHIKANGIRQHLIYYPNSQKNTIIIIPGVSSPAIMWDHVARYLQPKFNIILFDVRGRGLSESGDHLSYRLDEIINDISDTVKILNLSSITLMGHSMGARIGARFASLTKVVKKLIMLDPPASAPGLRPYPIPMERTISMVKAAQSGEGLSYLQQPHIAKWPDNLLKQRAEWLAMCDLRAIEEAYLDFSQQDIYQDIAQVHCPITLIAAENSHVINSDETKRFKDYQPHIHIIHMKNGEHQMQAQNKDSFLQLLDKIL